MKGHSYKLTWRLKEIDNGEVRKGNRKDVEMVSSVLSIYYHLVMVLFGGLQCNKCFFFFFFLPPLFPPSKASKQTTQPDHIIIFLVMALVFVLPCSTLYKGKFCRILPKIQPGTAMNMGVSPLPTCSLHSSRV